MTVKRITLKIEHTSLLPELRRVLIENKRDAVLFRGEVFTKPEFVNEMVYPANVNLFTESINALPLSEEILREPKIYSENEHFRFPEHYYAKRDDSYQKILKDALNIDPVDPDIYEEGVSLLRKYPKQLTLHYAVYGANVVNIIGVNDYPITIDATGNPDTGKSFSIVLALKMGYGIGEAVLQDDAMNTPFRHHAISNSTNLPVYTEEAKITDKAKLKSRAKNLRGNRDKTMDSYDVITTWVLSRNTDLLNEELNPIEKKAQEKRIYNFHFDKEDVLPKETFAVGKRFMEKSKNMPGGVLYEKLQQKTITEIREKYYELMRTEPDGRKVVSLLGAWIMDDPDFVPVVSEKETPDIKDEFIGKIIDADRRIRDMKGQIKADADFRSTFQDKQLNGTLEVDRTKGIFRITTVGFDLVKRELGITQSARAFAEIQGWKYNNVSIYGVKGLKGITGSLPKEEKEDVVKKDQNEEKIEDDDEGGENVIIMPINRHKSSEDKVKDELDDIL